jgi:hypothetical protein
VSSLRRLAPLFIRSASLGLAVSSGGCGKADTASAPPIVLTEVGAIEASGDTVDLRSRRLDP